MSPVLWLLSLAMRNPFWRGLFKAKTNDFYIEGPPYKVVASVAALLLLTLYGVYGIAVGRIYLPSPDGALLYRGVPATMMGIACIVVASGSMVRFHTRYRRAELVFGVCLLAFFAIFLRAMAIHDAG